MIQPLINEGLTQEMGTEVESNTESEVKGVDIESMFTRLPEDKIKEIKDILEDVQQTLKMNFASVILEKPHEILLQGNTQKSSISSIKRDFSLLEKAVLEREPFLISDASSDEKYSNNPFVKYLNFKFISSTPVMFDDETRIGNVLVVDERKRELTPYENYVLEASVNKITEIIKENCKPKKSSRTLKNIINRQNKSEVSYISTFSQTEVGCGEYRTSGLKELYNHPEIQNVIPFHEGITFQIFETIVARVKKGHVFEENITYSNIVADSDVQFKKIKMGDEEVLRIIFPDFKGLFPSDENCDADFKSQYHIQIANS